MTLNLYAKTGMDLSTIFTSGTGSQYLYIYGDDGVDIGQKFQAGSTWHTTGICAKDGQDLQYKFASSMFSFYYWGSDGNYVAKIKYRQETWNNVRTWAKQFTGTSNGRYTVLPENTNFSLGGSRGRSYARAVGITAAEGIEWTASAWLTGYQADEYKVTDENNIPYWGYGNKSVSPIYDLDKTKKCLFVIGRGKPGDGNSWDWACWLHILIKYKAGPAWLSHEYTWGIWNW